MRKQTVFTNHKWLNIDDDIRGRYNLYDVYATALVMRGLKAEMESNNQLNYFNTRIWPMVDVVMTMQQRGLRFNSAAKTVYRRKLRQELRETEALICTYSKRGDALNLNSPPQKAELLYDELGFKVPKTTGTGKRSTDQETLVAILRNLLKRDEPKRACLEGLFHRSRLNTIDTRYLEVVVDDDGRVRPTIKFPGTKTTRLAISQPALQQAPPEIRHLYYPEVGKVYVAADYSQIEARILAMLSSDSRSLEAFDKGVDIHTQNTLELFGWDLDHWLGMDATRKKAARDYAKGFLYGISYGGDPQTMKEKLYCPCPRCVHLMPPTLRLSRTENKAAADRWFARHQPVVKWRRQLVRHVLDGDHSYTNPLGHKRYFFTPYPAVERELYNEPMQTTAAGIINDAMMRLHYDDQAPLVLQMHDELMLEVPCQEVDLWARRLKAVMEAPIPELGNAVFPIDLAVGPDWRSLKTYTLS